MFNAQPVSAWRAASFKKPLDMGASNQPEHDEKKRFRLG
jgi:hypothetical protein